MPARPARSAKPDAIESFARQAASICLDSKAGDVVVLNLRGVADMTDFFVIANGTSDTHVRSVAEKVVEGLAKSGLHVHHIEGTTTGRWILLDFVDFVVHVFHPTMRTFYQLERLWSDAPPLVLEPQGATV